MDRRGNSDYDGGRRIRTWNPERRLFTYTAHRSVFEWEAIIPGCKVFFRGTASVTEEGEYKYINHRADIYPTYRNETNPIV